ncbi:MAG: non-canonical purine NTP pyrophosphatase [Lachnospiraceae bacterium]
MKLLFGTGNQAKLNVMKIRLKPLGINLIGLEDLKKEGYTVPSVPETGNTPLENARQKAMAYYQVFKMPVFSLRFWPVFLMRLQMKFSREFMFAM